MWLWIIVLVILGVAKSDFTKRPKYITACSKSSADFQKCLVDHGNTALPALLQGDTNIKLPKLLPYHIDKVIADAGPNLKITLTNIDLDGMDTVVLTEMNVDFDKNAVDLTVHADRASVIGTYDIDGKILILPIKGHGPLNITIVDSIFTYHFTFKLEKRDGLNYAIIQDNDSLEFKIGKAYFKLDNLFNGNVAMGDNVNKFLNENDQDILKELSSAIKSVIRSIARTAGEGVLSSIPFDELFLM